MKKKTGLIAVSIILIGITLTITITQLLISELSEYFSWFPENGELGVLIFIALYIIFGIIALPASFHKYLAGVLYGFGPGVLIAWIGSMLGAIAPFLLGKKWMNPYARKALSDYPALSGLEEIVVDDGAKVVALTRVSLVIPYGVLNYAFGATDIRFKDYLIGNLAMIVPAIMYAWWGSQTVLLADGFQTNEKTPFDMLMIFISLLITIAMIVKGKQIMDDFERSEE